MENRKVITRTRSSGSVIDKNFYFTQDMVPALRSSKALPDFLVEYRTRAWETYSNLPMPAISEEAWRRTDIRALNAGLLRLHTDSIFQSTNWPQVPEALLEPLVGDAHGGQIVIQPNLIKVELDPDLAAKGVVFTDLKTAEQDYPELLERIMGKVVRPDEGKFSGLAGAMSEAGIFVYIPKGLQVDQPLHSIFWGPGVDVAYFSHIMVLLEDGASLTLVHENASDTETEKQAMHAGIVELMVGDGANLRFVELQSWGDHVWNFTHERAQVARDGNLDWIFGALGSRLTKNFSDLDLIGQGATGRMSGFYFADGKQHFDLDTQQNHLAPHTTSDLLYKGALRDNSRSVWQGMIYVAPGAQKTDGYQANRNLVLSPKARADSIPGLEILADDVRCTHGATVGKIDSEQVFYLLSRGLPYSEAERLIVEGFFTPIMERIPFEGVRTRFQNAITQKMGTFA